MDDDLLQKLGHQDWDRISRILVAHVIRRTGIFAWRDGLTDVTLGLGKSPEDIVADVITKVFAGERTWDPDRGELVPTLMRQVDSELDHLWKRHARWREQPPAEDEQERQRQESDAVELDPALDPGDPEAAIERTEDRIAASLRVTALMAAVDDAPDLQELIDAIMDGCEPKPRFLAQRLGLPVEEINNRLRRLRRRATE